MDEATFEKNEETFSFLTQEADKGENCAVQMFYGIILPKLNLIVTAKCDIWENDPDRIPSLQKYFLEEEVKK